MRNQNTVLAPAAAEVINQVSGTYSAPFWDGLVAVTESLDTVKAVKGAIGISKAEILFQRFIEAAMIAGAALALSACVILLLWPQIGTGIYENMSSTMGPLDMVSVISALAITAGCGIVVLLLSTAFSSLGAMRLSPKEILSKLS